MQSNKGENALTEWKICDSQRVWPELRNSQPRPPHAVDGGPTQATRKWRLEPPQTEFQPHDHVTSAKPTSVISTSADSTHRASPSLCPSGVLLGRYAMADQMVAPSSLLRKSQLEVQLYLLV